jgi:hypothetical protein
MPAVPAVTVATPGDIINVSELTNNNVDKTLLQ